MVVVRLPLPEPVAQQPFGSAPASTISCTISNARRSRDRRSGGTSPIAVRNGRHAVPVCSWRALRSYSPVASNCFTASTVTGLDHVTEALVLFRRARDRQHKQERGGHARRPPSRLRQADDRPMQLDSVNRVSVAPQGPRRHEFYSSVRVVIPGRERCCNGVPEACRRPDGLWTVREGAGAAAGQRVGHGPGDVERAVVARKYTPAVRPFLIASDPSRSARRLRSPRRGSTGSSTASPAAPPTSPTRRASSRRPPRCAPSLRGTASASS